MKIKELENFNQWLANSKPNEKYVYFNGFSLTDTFISLELQKHTFEYACKGFIYLVQQKLLPHNYNFIAIKASVPAIKSLIPLLREQKSSTVSKPRIGIQKRVLITEHLEISGLN